MVEEKWLKILEGPGTITLGVRFLAEMESWILQVSSTSFSCCKQCCGAGAEGTVIKLFLGAGAVLTYYGSTSLFFYRRRKTMTFSIKIFINPREKIIKSKKVIFNMCSKTVCDIK